MAATVTAVPVSSANNVVPNNAATEEDEKYLYGENPDSTDKLKDETGSQQAQINGEIEENAQNGEDEDGEFEESDDDDDDINVHIGEVNAAATNQYGTPGSWKKDGAQAVAAAATATAAKNASVSQKKIDVNAVGLINGQPIYEYDMDADQDEKPWKKPGADISDYFNYGFTEDTWKQYCEKQRRMRIESARAPYSVATTGIVQPAAIPQQPQQQIELEVLPDGRTRVKAGPPPDRKVEGAIHVLGSDDARRKQKEEELLALALGSTRMMAPTAFPQQRMYTALPQGGLVYNPIGAPPPGSQPDMTQPPPEAQNTSQGQQIQSIGAPSAMTSVMPAGIQYLPAGPTPVGMHMGPGGAPIFPPPNVGIEIGQQEFMHPGNPGMPPPFNFQRGNSDSEFDSDGDSRRHRGRRESSRHRRTRDRSDRDRTRDRSTRDRDRDRSRTEHRDRSSSKRRHESSRSSSDKKKHSRSSSSRQDPDESGEKKSKRRIKTEIKEEPIDDPPIDTPQETPAPATSE